MPATPPFLRSLIRLDEVDSTSTYARRLAAGGSVMLPLLVRADRQTAGRGRGAHAWWSDGGSLTFTIVLDPAAHGLRAEHEPRLALAAAVALIDAIGPCRPGLAPGIRWPNDVEAGDRKLAGLLPERVETPDGPRLLLGVGVNIDSDLGTAPEEVRRLATTVATVRGGACGADELLRAILDHLPPTLAALARDDEGLARRWDGLDTLAGRPVRIDSGGRILTGVGRGIDARGGLRLEVEGVVTAVFGGQVLRESRRD